jgi:hypothetical protein
VPAVVRKTLSNRFLQGRRDRMQNIAFAGERSPEINEPFVDEKVHEARVLFPVVLLAQTTRPIPRTTAR